MTSDKFQFRISSEIMNPGKLSIDPRTGYQFIPRSIRTDLHKNRGIVYRRVISLIHYKQWIKNDGENLYILIIYRNHQITDVAPYIFL